LAATAWAAALAITGFELVFEIETRELAGQAISAPGPGFLKSTVEAAGADDLK